MRVLVTAFLLASVVSGAQTQQATAVEAKSTLSAPDPAPSPATLISRAKPLELDTPYVPPPGDPLSHHAAGFAKVMCSAVFITGLDPDFAADATARYDCESQPGSEANRTPIELSRRVRLPFRMGLTSDRLSEGATNFDGGDGI